MTKGRKISLFIAVLISINIVIGGGFFVSADNIGRTMGILAPLGWLACGLLLLPLVLVLSRLSSLYPSAGGIFVYSRERLGEFWGFLSGWGYFIGTLAGNAVILHEFSSLANELGLTISFAGKFSPFLSALIFDLFFLLLFSSLSLLNITIFEKANILFTALKLIPFGLVVVAGFFVFNVHNLTSVPVATHGLVSKIPIFLFAFLGIEACCSITHKIQDGEKNSARAMFIALILVIGIYSLIQFILLGIVGTSFVGNPFFNIVPLISSNPTVISYGNALVKLAILSSYLGGFYGMFYSNSWNLYAFAKVRRIILSNLFIRLNRYQTPWVCIVTQACLIFILLIVAAVSSPTLMTMSGFGVVIAYIFSVISYFTLDNKKPLKKLVGVIAILGCLLLFISCLQALLNDGVRYIIPFLCILGFGFFVYKRKI